MSEHLFALLPESLRGANLLLLVGALLAALLTAQRAQASKIDPTPLGNQLMLGLLIGLPLAAGTLLARPDAGAAGPGGPSVAHSRLALLGGLLVLLLGLLVAIRLRRLPLLRWLDVGGAPLLFGLAIGRLAGTVGLAASGAPLTAAPLLMPLWDLGAVGLLLWLEGRIGGRLRPGDGALLCGLLASAGRVLLLAASMVGPCGGPSAAGASCAAALHPAQLLSVGAFFGCAAILAWRRAPASAGPLRA